MKVIPSKEMARIEQLAYQKGFSEEDFMNRAGELVAEHALQLVARYHLNPTILLLCGSGNNGGDAFAAGVVLRERGVFNVHAYAISPLEKCSPLCKKQARRFEEMGGVITILQEASQIRFTEHELIIDGLLGTGFHGSVEGLLKEVIERANEALLPILSIDIPSGINGTSGERKTAIKASETLFLGLPKTGCFYASAWDHVGKVSVENFGLPDWCKELAHEDFRLIQEDEVKRDLPQLVRNRHKYQAGYVVGIGGSEGMPGAALLASEAALRAGAGIVRLLHPVGMEAALSFAPYELVRQAFDEKSLKKLLPEFERASSHFVGPGLKMATSSPRFFKKIVEALSKPSVFDAEALNFFSEQDVVIPPHSILTPHRGEMKKLLRGQDIEKEKELLDAVQNYVNTHHCIVVLKGSPTFIFSEQSVPFVCDRGDPGMATAGTGDVLTGMIAALLAQGLKPLVAAKSAVYLHALAGELAAQKKTSYSMIASDLIEALPTVYAGMITRW